MSDEAPDKPSPLARARQSVQATVHWLERVVTNPRDELNRYQAAVRFVYDLGIHGARQLRQDRAPQMAAALAFRTLFGLLPLLVVGTVLVRAAGGFGDFELSLQKLFASLGLDDLQVATSDSGETSQSLSAWLMEVVGQLSSINLTAITWLGLGVLGYSAISLLVTIESAFNVICRAPTSRAWAWRLLVYWALVTIGPGALVATMFVDHRFGLLLDEIVGWDWLLQSTRVLWSFIVAWLVMFVVYKLLPNTRVAARPALVGALVAALLIEAGKRLLGAYVADALSFRHVYGSLGLIPLFMFWVYLMWLVILFGLEVTSALQTLAGRRFRELEQRGETGLVEPAAILSAMSVIAKRFADSRSTVARDLAVHAGLPTPVARQMLERLADEGLLHRVEAGDDEEVAFALARPPEDIPADRVLALGYAMVDERPATGMAPVIARLRRTQLELASGETITSLLAEPPPADPGEGSPKDP